jgi:hypothetical protein
MLHRDGKEIIIFNGMLFTMAVEVLHLDMFGTLDIFIDTGDGETALLAFLGTYFLDDDRIDHLQAILFGLVMLSILFFKWHVDNEGTQVHPYLNGRKTYTVTCDHCIVHIIKQIMQRAVK